MIDIESFKWNRTKLSDSTIRVLSFSSDGKKIYSINGTWKVIDIETHETIKAIEGFNGSDVLTFSKEGRFLARFAYKTYHHELEIWASEAIEKIRTYNFGDIYVRALSVSPDGKILALSQVQYAGFQKVNSSEICLWDVELGQKIGDIDKRADEKYNSVFILSFSPDGKLIASDIGSGELELWWIDNFKKFNTIKCESRVQTFSFNPSNNSIAIGTEKGIELWDFETNRKICHFGKWPVSSLSFSQDGNLLVSEGAGVICIWHIDTRVIFAQFRTYEIPRFEEKIIPHSLQFSPSGELLISGNGGLFIWDPGYYLAIIKSNFTPTKEELETTDEFKKRAFESTQAFNKLKKKAWNYLYSKIYTIEIPVQLGQYSADIETFNIYFLNTEAIIKVPRDKAAQLIKSRDSRVNFLVEGKMRIVDADRFKLIQADFIDPSTNIRIRIDF